MDYVTFFLESKRISECNALIMMSEFLLIFRCKLISTQDIYVD